MPPLLLQLAGALGIGLGAASLVSLAQRGVRPPAALTRYVARLDHDLRFVGSPITGAQTTVLQLVALVAIVVAAAATSLPKILAAVPVALAGPLVLAARARKKRVEALELQVDGFLTAYANALKAIPNVAAALAAVTHGLSEPIRGEIDQILRRMRVGATLPEALRAWADRVESRVVDDALSAILVGIQIGGDLPGVLRNTAAALREMQRLDGVVRTKTAEGKAQMWVLAGFPLVIALLFNAAQPGYFAPLEQSLTGFIVTTAAVLLWLGAIAFARKILSVDI